MLQIGLIVAVCLIVGIGALIVYGKVIQSNLAVAAIAQGKQAQLDVSTGWSWFVLKLQNWKTIILAWIAAAAQIFQYITSDVVTGWQSLPWAQVFDQHVANWITIACAMLIPITHAMGVKTAAVTAPAPTTDGS